MQPMRTIVISLLLVLAPHLWAQQGNPPKPPKSPEQIPDIRTVKAIIICGNCGHLFDGATHEEILDGLVSNAHVSELRRALYLQDTVHQFESKVHFDNCDFNAATDYIDSLLAEVDGHVRAAKKARDAGDSGGIDSAVKKAFFALGQALHGVQDFYAHTNYVELSVSNVTRSTDIDIVAPWTSSGKDRIKDLSAKGLISGFVFWGFPQKCPSGTASHADLAKDKATTKSGAVKIPHFENRSQYQIAVQLAGKASQEFIDDAFLRWPLLKEVNGEHVAFEILVDRREL